MRPRRVIIRGPERGDCCYLGGSGRFIFGSVGRDSAGELRKRILLRGERDRARVEPALADRARRIDVAISRC